VFDENDQKRMDLKLYCNEKRIIGEYGKGKGTPFKI
jgi:hypothetical protein